MKKLFTLLVTAFVLLLSGCTTLDTTGIWNELNNLKDAQEELEEEQEKMQAQIDAQQTLLNALSNDLVITSITPTTEGFVLTFSDNSSITIKHGEKGEKGDKGEKGETGAQGEKGDKGEKGEDGADGKDGEDGADGKDGQDGQDGADGKDGEDGKDGADGKDGDSFFQSVTWDEEYAYFTLADGSVITIPLASGATGGEEEGDLPPANEIWYTSTDGEVVTPYATDVFGANIVSNTYEDGVGIITFDGDVTSIGDGAFVMRTNLKSIIIPESVTEIGMSAFVGCESLASITIPESVTSIGQYTFSGCSSLASVTIPNGVTSIGAETFNECSSLTSITIPDSVTSIGQQAFSGCSSLESVTIPDSVTEIGKYAFDGCTNLINVNIPQGVTSLENQVFCRCSSLTNIIIPDSVISIGEHAFSYCSSLTSVTIGNGVISIASNAFVDCSSLEKFNGKFASEDGRCLIIDGVLNFFAPAGLTEYTIPDGVTSIVWAFSGCSSLASITIPDSVNSIGNYAFYECSSLTSITIPDSVIEIGYRAFSGCTSLTSVYCKAVTPPAGGWYMFDYNASGRKIYVPTESVDAYKAADYWSEYADYIVGYDFGGGGSGDTDGVKEVAAVSLFGMYRVMSNFYMIGGYVSSGEDAGYNPPMDSWNYGFNIISDTEPVNDEIPLGTYTYVDYEKLVSGEEELKTGIFTITADWGLWCAYVDANGEMQEYKYTEGTIVVSEGKIELTVTLDNGEVHHVVYEGSLQTWGEAA